MPAQLGAALARLIHTRDQFYKTEFKFQDADEFAILIDALAAIASDPTSAGWCKLWQESFRDRACGPCFQENSAFAGGSTKLLCVAPPPCSCARWVCRALRRPSLLVRLIYTLMQKRFSARFAPGRAELLVQEILRRPMKSLQDMVVPRGRNDVVHGQPARYWKNIISRACNLSSISSQDDEDDASTSEPNCAFGLHAALTVLNNMLPEAGDDRETVLAKLRGRTEIMIDMSSRNYSALQSLHAERENFGPGLEITLGLMTACRCFEFKTYTLAALPIADSADRAAVVAAYSEDIVKAFAPWVQAMHKGYHQRDEEFGEELSLEKAGDMVRRCLVLNPTIGATPYLLHSDFCVFMGERLHEFVSASMVDGARIDWAKEVAVPEATREEANQQKREARDKAFAAAVPPREQEDSALEFEKTLPLTTQVEIVVESLVTATVQTSNEVVNATDQPGMENAHKEFQDRNAAERVSTVSNVAGRWHIVSTEETDIVAVDTICLCSQAIGASLQGTGLDIHGEVFHVVEAGFDAASSEFECKMQFLETQTSHPQTIVLKASVSAGVDGVSMKGSWVDAERSGLLSATLCEDNPVDSGMVQQQMARIRSPDYSLPDERSLLLETKPRKTVVGATADRSRKADRKSRLKQLLLFEMPRATPLWLLSNIGPRMREQAQEKKIDNLVREFEEQYPSAGVTDEDLREWAFKLVVDQEAAALASNPILAARRTKELQLEQDAAMQIRIEQKAVDEKAAVVLQAAVEQKDAFEEGGPSGWDAEGRSQYVESAPVPQELLHPDLTTTSTHDGLPYIQDVEPVSGATSTVNCVSEEPPVDDSQMAGRSYWYSVDETGNAQEIGDVFALNETTEMDSVRGEDAKLLETDLLEAASVLQSWHTPSEVDGDTAGLASQAPAGWMQARLETDRAARMTSEREAWKQSERKDWLQELQLPLHQDVEELPLQDCKVATKTPKSLASESESDQLLRAAVEKHGVGNWKAMENDDAVPGMTGTQMRKRWKLVDARDKGVLTKLEPDAGTDNKLIAAVEKWDKAEKTGKNRSRRVGGMTQWVFVGAELGCTAEAAQDRWKSPIFRVQQEHAKPTKKAAPKRAPAALPAPVTGDRKRDQFMATLFEKLSTAGTPVAKIPLVAKVPLDLYRLRQLVLTHGGFAKVVSEKNWKPIAVELGISLTSCSDYGARLRKHYQRFLLILDDQADATAMAGSSTAAEEAAAPVPVRDDSRKREEDKAAKKRAGEVKAAARPPKRAKSAYAAFAADESVVSKLKTAHPDASSAELTKLKKTQWDELPEAERKAFTDAEAADKLRFAREVAAKASVLQDSGAAAAADLDEDMVAAEPVLEPPKPPTSAYSFFAADKDVLSKLKTANPDASAAELTKLKKQHWKELPELDRKQFTDAESADQLRYKNELLALSAKLQGKRPADEDASHGPNSAGDKASAAAAPPRKRSRRQPVPSARKLAAGRGAG
eukprot:COSAG04_NODE_114_length_25503_cov_39.366832_2_plen_1470_part_00